MQNICDSLQLLIDQFFAYSVCSWWAQKLLGEPQSAEGRGVQSWIHIIDHFPLQQRELQQDLYSCHHPQKAHSYVHGERQYIFQEPNCGRYPC
jgi:hypothetical protein